MICSKCGAECNDGTIFCRKCGTRLNSSVGKNCKRCGKALPPDSVFCDECGFNNKNDLPVNNDVCANCGAKLNAESKFCHKCGTPVGQPTAPLRMPRTKPALDEGLVFDNTARPATNLHPATPPSEPPVASVPPTPPVVPKTSESPAKETTLGDDSDENNMEKTMTIPVIKPSMIAEYKANKEAERASALKRPPVAPKPSAPAGSTPHAAPERARKVYNPARDAEDYNAKRRKEEAAVRTQKNVLMFLVVFLIVILIGCSVLIAIVLSGRGKEEPTPVKKEPAVTQDAESPVDEEPEEPAEEEEKPQEPENEPEEGEDGEGKNETLPPVVDEGDEQPDTGENQTEEVPNNEGTVPQNPSAPSVDQTDSTGTNSPTQ